MTPAHYVIEKLGEALALAEAEIARLQQLLAQHEQPEPGVVE